MRIWASSFVFLMKALSSVEVDEIVTIAQQCITELNISAAPERRDERLIPVQVLLIDNSTRKIHIEASATLGHLSMKLGERVKVGRIRDFGFFQLTDGLETHRPLSDSVVLARLSEKWHQLKVRTGRPSRLLWKRRFLRPMEVLDAGDLVHATLTCQQATWDYLRYPVVEDMDLIARIAGMILCHEKDHFWPYVRDRRLHEIGVLEQVLPQHVLRYMKRRQWAQKVYDAYAAVTVSLPQEARLQRMCRLFSLLQRLRLFGVYHWLGRQVPPPEEDAEPPHHILDTADPCAEYWICVDLAGIRFVSVDCDVGAGVYTSFSFDEEAQERIVQWSARGNIAHFVVRIGKTFKAIDLLCPAAIDISMILYGIPRELSLD